MGVDEKTASKYFSKELLATSVYGSSFLKFFQENSQKLAPDNLVAPEKLPNNFVNGYDNASMTIGQRLDALGISAKDTSGMFGKDILNLAVDSEEFTDFIVKNQAKFLGKLDQLAGSEKGKNAPKS